MMEYTRGEKRKRNDRGLSPSYDQPNKARHDGYSRGGQANGSKNWAYSDQARINQLQEAEKHREFLAQEGQFLLQQKRKAAEIRVKEGRARPIDWLAINLRMIDPVEDLLNDDLQEEEPDFIAVEDVIGGLTASQLAAVRKEIDEFLAFERKSNSKDYWQTIRIICRDRQKGVEEKAVRSVSADIDNLLRPKSYEELNKLEKQINRKLDSDEPIDTDYWQQLLENLLVYKAKTKLKKMYANVLDKKLARLREKNVETADRAVCDLPNGSAQTVGYSKAVDPDALLKLDAKDEPLLVIDEREFLDDLAQQRRKVVKTGYIPASIKNSAATPGPLPSRGRPGDVDKTASSMFDREAAKGVEEDEEVFAGEEDVETKNAELWKGNFRPRKPRYFNRVQMGYEWNKYNQTHYDHDNPPPKVVQGYKFHVFYPDLIDITKAPTYKITREGGRKKGETLAPAGEEDTCIIRFIAGPPYQDIAFRIVDRDWDYSAKHDRGFKSTFEKGILTLHFSFKKVYYRK